MWTKITHPTQIKLLFTDHYLLNTSDAELPREPDKNNPDIYQVKEVASQMLILYQSSRNSYTLCSFPFEEILNGEWWVWHAH